MMGRILLGIGNGINYASNAQMGIVTNRLRIGYVYEFPNGGGYNLTGNTH